MLIDWELGNKDYPNYIGMRRQRKDNSAYRYGKAKSARHLKRQSLNGIAIKEDINQPKEYFDNARGTWWDGKNQ